MSSHAAKRPFRKATGVPSHMPPLRPQTAKTNASNDIIEERQTNTNQNKQRPPTVIRNKATVSRPDSRVTPRKMTQVNSNIPSKRPTTAQPMKGQRSNQIQGEIDYEAETAKLRAECQKEFDITIDEKDTEQPWLQHLTSIQDKLNENIYQTEIIDDNPISIMDQVSDEILKSESVNDDPFKNANKILDDSFAQFQQYMEQEKLLLDQRISLLQEFGHEISQHPASDYTADTEIDETDDLSNPIIIQTKMRPKTSSNARRDRGNNDERRYVRKP